MVEVVGVEPGFAEEQVASPEFAELVGGHVERLAEGSGEGLLGFEARHDGDIDDPRVGARQALQRSGKATGADVGLERLAGDR